MINRTLSRVAATFLVFATVFGMTGTVFAAPNAPAGLSVVGGVYTNDTTPTFTWTKSAGATWYEILVDNGDWISLGNTSSYTVWPLNNGWHTFYVRAHSNDGGVSTSASIVIEIDTVGPRVTSVTPTKATVGTPVTFTIDSGSDDVRTSFCVLVINGKEYGMTSRAYSADMLHHQKFDLVHTFGAAGTYSVYAFCKDGDGNYTTGGTAQVVVSRGSATPYGNDGLSKPVVNVPRGTVVKAQCDSFAPVSDDCHAVYYYGNDGKKHAFPTESVYMSWFSSYSNLKIISPQQLRAMPTGENVTFRPGTALVKFSGSSTVYAVEKGSVLRPIATESAARAIYGSSWTRYVVTVVGSLKRDYSIGSTIYSSSDYSKVRAYHSVNSIESCWE